MMTNAIINLQTQYAPAERYPMDEVINQYNELSRIEFLEILMNSISEGFAILNDRRQIIYANNFAIHITGAKDFFEIIGKRLGEAINCENSELEPNDCGTSEKCEFCGAINSVLSSTAGFNKTEYCSIIDKNSNALDLKIFTKSFTYNHRLYILTALQDASSEKRKRALEKIFFHDIINTFGGINGLIKLINETPEESINLMKIISQQLEFAIDEIQAQKDILSAENDELIAKKNIINSLDLIKSVVDTYANHPSAMNKKLIINSGAEDIIIISDYTLLRRVLGNIVKNALEASEKEQCVTISCNKSNDWIIFKVNNQAYIPREIQMQIFKRSFSTKGEGRGLGTYSIRLLTTRYLNGKVYFSTSKQDGTTFYLQIPLRL